METALVGIGLHQSRSLFALFINPRIATCALAALVHAGAGENVPTKIVLVQRRLTVKPLGQIKKRTALFSPGGLHILEGGRSLDSTPASFER